MFFRFISTSVYQSRSRLNPFRTMAKYTVVMIRHGESTWNQQNRFCGWFDADLSAKGIEEAKTGGKILKDKGYTFDVAFTSLLKRAIKTLYIVQDEMDLHWIPVVRHWRLNERMYGGLQGLNKSETAAKHGEDQVKIWRRSYDTPPPLIDLDNPMYPGNDARYKNVDPSLIPRTECLKDTVHRALPFWYDAIVPEILAGKRVLISAHGNSLRAMVKYLDNISDNDIVGMNIPTAFQNPDDNIVVDGDDAFLNGIPLVYELDEKLKPMKHFYLADEATVKAAMDKVANQGKAK